MFKLYVFSWYDSFSDNGWNEKYYITDNPEEYAKEIGFDCEYKEFNQEGFEIEIRKLMNKNEQK